jgi:hypothetical protein
VEKITYKIIIITIVLSALLFSGCIHNNFDEPPEKEFPAGMVMTIQDIEQIYYDSVAPTMRPYKFKDDFSVYAVVTMDDKSGNIYKNAYIQDATKGINLRLLSSGGIYEGDSILLNLRDLVLSDYNGMLQLDSVHVDNNILKLKTGVYVVPEKVRIGQITDWHVSRLIEVEDVQFINSDVGNIYANPDVSENRTLENCNGNTLIVRNSGYSNFASEIIPRYRGSIVGVLGKYGTDYQLYIRSIDEVKLVKPRCGEVDTIFSETFDETVRDVPIDFTGWKNIGETGTIKWVGTVLSGNNPAAQIKNDENENTSWLILPKQTISENVAMKFVTLAYNVAGAQLQVLISADYNGGDSPQDANWTVLPATIATSLESRVDSGEIDLPQGEIYIAFKFSAATSSRAQYFLDDIIIYLKD